MGLVFYRDVNNVCLFSTSEALKNSWLKNMFLEAPLQIVPKWHIFLKKKTNWKILKKCFWGKSVSQQHKKLATFLKCSECLWTTLFVICRFDHSTVFCHLSFLFRFFDVYIEYYTSFFHGQFLFSNFWSVMGDRANFVARSIFFLRDILFFFLFTSYI